MAGQQTFEICYRYSICTLAMFCPIIINNYHHGYICRRTGVKFNGRHLRSRFVFTELSRRWIAVSVSSDVFMFSSKGPALFVRYVLTVCTSVHLIK